MENMLQRFSCISFLFKPENKKKGHLEECFAYMYTVNKVLDTCIWSIKVFLLLLKLYFSTEIL